VLELGIDITDRIHAEEELRRSEESYRLLADTMSEGLGASDENFIWTYANDRLCEMLGFPRNEVVGRKVTDFVDEDGKRILEAQRARRMEGREAPYELTWTKRDGTRVTAIISPRAILDSEGRFKGSFAVITDISERRRSEEALRESERQLRSVSSQLLLAQETERRRISRELHDELGQSLTIMKLRLGLLAREVRKDQAKLRREVKGTMVHIDQTIEGVRRLSRDLSPSVLEDLGLRAGLRRLVKEFVKLNELKVSLQITEGIDKLLTKDAEIILYRVIQEALTNIGKHAKAGKIRLAIERRDRDIRVLVEDDGRGFDPARPSDPERTRTGLGLAIMRQRVQMLGGQLELWSERGKGTRLIFSIPLAQTPGAGSESRNVEPGEPGGSPRV
jgi:PAS domain S-box-containing protein